MATIIEALYNAKHNYANAIKYGSQMPGLKALADNQQNNAIALLEKGYPADTDIEQTIEEYGSIDNAPDLTD